MMMMTIDYLFYEFALKFKLNRKIFYYISNLI